MTEFVTKSGLIFSRVLELPEHPLKTLMDNGVSPLPTKLSLEQPFSMTLF